MQTFQSSQPLQLCNTCSILSNSALHHSTHSILTMAGSCSTAATCRCLDHQPCHFVPEVPARKQKGSEPPPQQQAASSKQQAASKQKGRVQIARFSGRRQLGLIVGSCRNPRKLQSKEAV